MARYRKSQFKSGSKAELKKDVAPFSAATVVTVENGRKCGKNYKILVHDVNGRYGRVPSKYLKKI